MTTDLWQAEPLFGFRRGNVDEVVVHGFATLKQQGKPLNAAAADTRVVGRSLLKPWQFFAAGIVQDEANYAVGMASHSGQDIHLKALCDLMQEAKLQETDLQCPSSMPMDREVATKLRSQGAGKNRLYHPCSGKHLFALWACKRNDWDLATYLQPSHPLQQKLAAILQAGGAKKMSWTTDSCGLPTAILSWTDHMQLWEALALDTTSAAQILKGLWAKYPEMVGGAGRLDTDLVRAADGWVLAKEGADGLLMVQTLPDGTTPVQGCLVKIASGYNPTFLALGLHACLLSHKRGLNKTMTKVLQYLEGRLSEWVPKDQVLSAPPRLRKT